MSLCVVDVDASAAKRDILAIAESLNAAIAKNEARTPAPLATSVVQAFETEAIGDGFDAEHGHLRLLVVTIMRGFRQMADCGDVDMLDELRVAVETLVACEQSRKAGVQP